MLKDTTRREFLRLAVDVGIHRYPGDLPEHSAQAAAERRFMREYFLRSPCLYEFHTCPQGYCSGGIYCAAFESVREEVRLLQAFAGAAGAALHECFQRVFPIGQHESGAHGTVKPLVSGGADDVYSVIQA